MDRRRFIGAITGGLLAAPLAAEAQLGAGTWKVGFLSGGGRPPDGAPPLPLRQALQELGYVEQRNVVATEPARGVHQHPQGPFPRVRRGLLGHEGLGLQAGAIDQPRVEQPLGALGALRRGRRGHRHPGVGQRLELPIRRVAEGGGRLDPERGEDARRLRPVYQRRRGSPRSERPGP